MLRMSVITGMLVLATAAGAESVDSKTAKGLLYKSNSRAVEVFPADFLGAAETKALEKFAKSLAYYAAFALSPGDPVENGAAVGLANYHSVTSAKTAALAACEKRRTSGKPCIIIAVTTPKGYEPKTLELSAEATEALRKEYRKTKSPKAMAISPSTGAWAIRRGDGGRARSACNESAAKNGASDCKIAIFDDE